MKDDSIANEILNILDKKLSTLGHVYQTFYSNFSELEQVLQSNQFHSEEIKFICLVTNNVEEEKQLIQILNKTVTNTFILNISTIDENRRWEGRQGNYIDSIVPYAAKIYISNSLTNNLQQFLENVQEIMKQQPSAQPKPKETTTNIQDNSKSKEMPKTKDTSKAKDTSKPKVTIPNAKVPIVTEKVNEAVQSKETVQSGPTNKDEDIPVKEQQVNEATPTEEVTTQQIPEVTYQVDGGTQTRSQVQYQQDSYQSRARQIQRQLFSKQQWEGNQVVAVWSPLHRMGVTTFTMNFAFYLAKHRIYTTVLEGLTNQPKLKEYLLRYTGLPAEWSSYATIIQEGQSPNAAEWMYKDVLFLPMKEKDLHYKWNHLSLEAYMTTTKIMDVTLVDLPTGHLENYTRDALKFTNELWILLDDSATELLVWTEYIKQLKKELDIPIYLIFHKAFPFSKQTKLCEAFDLTMLTSIPAMEETVSRNQYQPFPLLETPQVQTTLFEAYAPLAKHLLGFEPTLPQMGRENLMKKFLGRFLKPRNV